MLGWLDSRCKTIAAILALVGSIATGAWALDSRYARSDDLVAQATQLQRSLGDLKTGQLQSDRRALQREKFELENIKKTRGKLTVFEERRLQAVTEEITNLDGEILQSKQRK